MSQLTREERLVDMFATLADTLIDDYDVVDLLQTLVDTCVSTFEVAAAGLLLSDDGGDLEVLVSTSEESRLVETMQLSAEAGPCIESFRTGTVISVTDLDQGPPDWKPFRTAAREHGFTAVHAIPLRLRETTIGALNLFQQQGDSLGDRDLRAARALADVATIGILHERTLRASDVAREQLQNALNSRVTIEQAKGILAYTHGVSMEEAFSLLRNHARSNQLPLALVARQLVDRTIIF
ncbi:GAF and ANTAR domain-containing protein [Agromyces albus]|uniref:ANTAR domain-containing protein n=1 Tax=Agromyces albus TaxID=205332 RepID=A0A4V1QYB5_9MICO|nr:GAF and ANTAR domain-containing protein [Agromyces albus]RXZ72576.1 ANTAR domain-containing protein [Agromyces albus]